MYSASIIRLSVNNTHVKCGIFTVTESAGMEYVSEKLSRVIDNRVTY